MSSNQKILDAMSVVLTPKLFFGKEEWQNKFPDKEIIFPNFILPTKEELQHPSAITGKSIAHALNDGDYIAIIIPKTIDGQLVSLKLLHQELFLQIANPDFAAMKIAGTDNEMRKMMIKTFYSQSIAQSGLMIAKLTPLEDSFNKVWRKQQETLPDNHRIACVAEEVIKHFCYYLLTEQYVNQSVAGRTTDVNEYGSHVGVGYFNDEGLDIKYWSGGYYPFIGVASVWEFLKID